MTDQPRDLAAEVETIAAQVKLGWPHMYHFVHAQAKMDIGILLTHIAALSREIEEHREALAWVLDEGVVKAIHHIQGKPVPRLVNNGDYDSMEPPAHLAPILAGAMRSKT